MIKRTKNGSIKIGRFEIFLNAGDGNHIILDFGTTKVLRFGTVRIFVHRKEDKGVQYR